MTRAVIIAVGGTGQLVLHYYAQLFQVGAISDPFDAVVLDSDALMPSLERFRTFWQDAKLAHPDESSVPQLEYIAVAEGIAGRIENVLAGQPLPHAPQVHPVEAFFDSESLKQQVNEGLFARPALSSVMRTEWDRLPLPSFAGVQRVITVGSTIGGTGGGLMAPLMNELAARLRAVGTDRPRLCAVLFGQYFKVEGLNQLVRDARDRYPSNKLFVARTLQELAPPELEHFIFVEPTNPVERDTAKERSPINMLLPDGAHPIWEGISALEEVRTNTTWPSAQLFEDKECRISSGRSQSRDLTTLNQRTAVATALSEKSVITNLLGEVWFDRFYGRALPTIVSRAYSVARRHPVLGISSVRKFADLVQQEYDHTWTELKAVFPLSTSRANLPEIRDTDWAGLRTQVPELTQSAAGLLRLVSANILYSALRGGRS